MSPICNSCGGLEPQCGCDIKIQGYGSVTVRLKVILIMGCLGTSLFVTSASAAQKAEKTSPRAEILQKLIDCRSISDSAERLACFETQTAKIDEAEAKRDLVIIDRDIATKSRKENFGLPTKPLVVGKTPALGEGVTDVTSKIRSVKLLNNNRWLFVLEDGARWYQAESKSIRQPKPGQMIRIRKASFGGYLANVNGQIATRVRRIDQP
jgi:hypothetical protein